MRTLARALFIILLFAQAASSQTSSPSPQPSRTAEHEAELAEASRLARSAVSLSDAGKLDEAFPIAKRVVQIRERILGKDDDWVASAVINLAELQIRRGQSESAAYQSKFSPTTVGGKPVKVNGFIVYRFGR